MRSPRGYGVDGVVASWGDGVVCCVEGASSLGQGGGAYGGEFMGVGEAGWLAVYEATDRATSAPASVCGHHRLMTYESDS